MSSKSLDEQPIRSALEYPLHRVEILSLTSSEKTITNVQLDGRPLHNVKSWRLEQAGPRRVPELTITLFADVSMDREVQHGQ